MSVSALSVFPMVYPYKVRVPSTPGKQTCNFPGSSNFIPTSSLSTNGCQACEKKLKENPRLCPFYQPVLLRQLITPSTTTDISSLSSSSSSSHHHRHRYHHHRRHHHHCENNPSPFFVTRLTVLTHHASIRHTTDRHVLLSKILLLYRWFLINYGMYDPNL